MNSRLGAVVVRVAPPPIDEIRCAPRIKCGAGFFRITR